jgi:hypothetical protein
MCYKKKLLLEFKKELFHNKNAFAMTQMLSVTIAN